MNGNWKKSRHKIYGFNHGETRRVSDRENFYHRWEDNNTNYNSIPTSKTANCDAENGKIHFCTTGKLWKVKFRFHACIIKIHVNTEALLRQANLWAPAFAEFGRVQPQIVLILASFEIIPLGLKSNRWHVEYKKWRNYERLKDWWKQSHEAKQSHEYR